MKHSPLLLGVTFVGAVFVNSAAFAKTAKDCTAEWRADKAGMQARGVTEKAYVAQCRGDATPTASAPAPIPSASAPSTSQRRADTTSTGKTAKDCVAEWRADKAGMKARGVTEKAYVEQCRGGGTTPTSSAPSPSTITPAPTRTQSGSTTSQKTAKDCIAEWRADKAGMQARGTTEKTYVESCKGGGLAPTATAPQPAPTAAPAPAPRQASPETQAAPAPKPAPTITTAAPAPPVRAPSANNNGATLEAGQFADEGSAKARCPTDTVVWVNLKSKIYHFAGTKSYGTTERGAYMCEKDAVTAEDRAAKNETHPN